ncbi:IFI27 [Symbiodinium necroappetens]|uniref:IFI27 protein n=1 Tax=Symbiodinium necroappetens TaxID=1628268 RepID=A0A812X1S7_9DINO|nr:IFI27 [Symbiodinium necroappetens]
MDLWRQIGRAPEARRNGAWRMPQVPMATSWPSSHAMESTSARMAVTSGTLESEMWFMPIEIRVENGSSGPLALPGCSAMPSPCCSRSRCHGCIWGNRNSRGSCCDSGNCRALGFTAEGIAAGSAAAGMMSAAAIAEGGGVAAGSTVATLQAVGTGASLAGTALAGTICAVALPVTAVVGLAVWAGVVTNCSFLTNPLKDKPPQGKWMLGTEEGVHNVLFYEFSDEPTAVHAFDDVKTSRILFNKEHREVRCAGLNFNAIETIRVKARHA